ncbi:hypothetical protein DICVIV_11755 [Dictyocaulus viviparus]|uniref:Synaptophysin / synaptoporin n=1 Tax=Dictyocaulus viviparus TaxID=29172 RepID=A0A0D8XF03_DICVI|nr:hypothetical protein DICVIV_11755 [Dictyocaulus viviparus]
MHVGAHCALSVLLVNFTRFQVLAALLWFSVSKGGWHRLNGSTHHQICLYGSSASTCSFASALGFFSLVSAGVLLLSDMRLEKISSIPTRKRFVTADMTISAVLYLQDYTNRKGGSLKQYPYEFSAIKLQLLKLLVSSIFQILLNVVVDTALKLNDIIFCSQNLIFKKLLESRNSTPVFTGIFLIAFFTLWSKFASFDLNEPYSSRYAKFGIFLAFLSTLAWGGAAFFAWRRYEEGAMTALGGNFNNEFSGIDGDAQDGYGYGGSSDGIGSVGVSNTSYQAGAPPTIPANPNPFVGTEGYGY